MNTNGAFLIFGIYLVVIGFSLWLGCTFVLAVVRISRAAESMSHSLAEIARKQSDASAIR